MRTEEFYNFLTERELVRFRKETGEPKPWTKDIILQNYKFTNVKRENDTTTRKLREMYYENPAYESLPLTLHLLNAAIFRYFGTWEFAEAVGYATIFDPERVRKVAKERMLKEQRVFTGAYVISSFGIHGSKVDVIIDNVIIPLWKRAKEIVAVIVETGSWEKAIEIMKTVKGFQGTGFMAKEVILDTLFTPLWASRGGFPLDFNTWCPVGPGAIRGLNRVFGRDKNYRMTDSQMQSEMIAVFEEREKFLPSGFPELVLHDIQFQLCEFDKYERVRLNEGRPRSRYNGAK